MRLLYAVGAILILSLFLFSVAGPAVVLAVDEPPSDPVEEAISKGISWVSRAVAEINDNEAVMRDHVGIPIAIIYNNTLFMAGGFYEPKHTYYKAELLGFQSDGVYMRFYFNPDKSGDYDVVLYVRYYNDGSYTQDKLYIYVEKCTLSGVILRVGSYPVVYQHEIHLGSSITLTADVGGDAWYYSQRYVARHSTRIAAWLLEDYQPSLAQKLLNFMEDHGYTFDVYDPLFGKSGNVADFDQAAEAVSTWKGKGYSDLPWFGGINAERDLYPYYSKVVSVIEDLGADVWYTMFEHHVYYKLLKAAWYLDRYGSDGQSQAESLISEALDEGGWDGYGLRRGSYTFYYSNYPTYLNAILLIVLSKYYRITGDRYINGQDILAMADRLAGILVKLQWDYEEEVDGITVKLATYRGSFASGYRIDGVEKVSTGWGDSGLFAWSENIASLIDKHVLSFLENHGIYIAGFRMMAEPENPFAFTNSETTILAIQALREYEKLGRTPYYPSSHVDTGGGEIYDAGHDSGGEGDTHGSTSYDGRVITAHINTAYGEEGWYYQYAVFKFPVEESGNYNLSLAAALSYRLEASTPGDEAEIEFSYMVYDSNHNAIAGACKIIKDIGSSTNVVEEGGLVTLTANIGNLSPGTYYVEVGVIVRGVSTSVGHALSDAADTINSYQNGLRLDWIHLEPAG